MSIGLTTGANNLQTLEKWQATIAHNLANSSTPGFQKASFEVVGRSLRPVQSTEGTADARTLIPTGMATRPIGKGEIKITNNPYDMAIQGEGFFSVQGEGGQVMYTRDGEFHLNNEGTLVNKMGYPVMAGGGAIEVQKEEGPISVAPDGTVSQNGQAIERISVHRFNNPEMLHGSGSYFIDPQNAAGVELIENPIVRQNQLEMSTVSPLREMVSMMEVSRAYEITQKLIEDDEERAQKAIQTFSV
ncbi:MAG: flagellar hook-basal body protein [Puniceicoccaceae bacterium]